MINEIIKELERVKKEYPELRVGQIIDKASGQLFPHYISDEDLLKGLEKL